MIIRSDVQIGFFLLFNVHSITQSPPTDHSSFTPSTSSASTLNSLCTTSCAISGMICVNGRCRCDLSQRLFWTGTRCWPCPNSWTMADASCLHLNVQPMNYRQASDYCHSMQSELFTFQNSDLEPIYTVTRSRRRRKRQGTIEQRTIAWTSAHASDFDDVGLYEWADPDLPPFDRSDPSWCRTADTVGLGYSHPFDEPTQRTIDDETEKCVIFRRGRTALPMYCLDDVFCTEKHSVVCERSEFAIVHFPDTSHVNHPRDISSSSSSSPYRSSSTSGLQLGSSKTSLMATGTRTTTRKTVVGGKTNTTTNGNVESNKDPHLTDLQAMNKDKARANKQLRMIVLAIIALFLLVMIIAAIVFFLKCRDKRRPRRSRFDEPRVSNPSSSAASEFLEPSEASIAADEPVEAPLPAPIFKNQPATAKRGGFTKQQFDDFE